MKSEQEIVSDLATILSDFQGRQYGGAITSDTMFFADLGFVSIDAVVLGETLQTYFAQPIPFQSFLAELAQEQVQDIGVGRLAAFLHRSINDL